MMQPDNGVSALLRAQGFRRVARLRQRSAREIGTSPWSIGCETIDRGYVDFAQTGPHLSDLCATQARVQAGWARCEPSADGRYDWAWLDAIVDGCTRQGVRPWLETSYGNPAYPGGGGIGLAEGLPTSPQALAAWDNWVRAMVQRYADRVNTWEVWNEPDIHNAMTPEHYAAFFIRTASIIRSVDQSANIVGLALAGKLDFAGEFVSQLSRQGRADLLDEVTFHFYPHNPDDAFDRVATLQAMVREHAPHATVRQGETGALSETRRFMALGEHEWSERKQAAWDLRRLLAHHARGIPMSLFQLADMQYTKAQGAKFEGRNSKGLLCVNADKTVAYRKPSYFAARNVFSTFDGRIALHALEPMRAQAPFSVAAYTWTCGDGRTPAIVGWWRNDIPPELAAPVKLHEASLPPVPLRDPVLLDLLSGDVFAVPSNDSFWLHLACVDVPLLLAERGILHLDEIAEAAR